MTKESGDTGASKAANGGDDDTSSDAENYKTDKSIIVFVESGCKKPLFRRHSVGGGIGDGSLVSARRLMVTTASQTTRRSVHFDKRRPHTVALDYSSAVVSFQTRSRTASGWDFE
jgi:hypothetical protein